MEKQQDKGSRPHIPAAIHRIWVAAANKAGVPLKFWLYEAVKEKAARETSEALLEESK